MITKLAVVLLVPALSLTGCGADDSAGPDTASPTSSGQAPARSVDLQSAELQSQWWTWATQPLEVNPVADSTGDHCAQEQPATVWLVAGSLGGTAHRRCTVPDDRPIAGPVVNLAGRDAAECKSFLATAKGTVTLDGKKVAVAKVKSVPFEFTAQDRNPTGFEVGRVEAVGCGLWFTVPPLAAGSHTLAIRGSKGGFPTATTYDLTSKSGGDG